MPEYIKARPTTARKATGRRTSRINRSGNVSHAEAAQINHYIFCERMKLIQQEGGVVLLESEHQALLNKIESLQAKNRELTEALATTAGQKSPHVGKRSLMASEQKVGSDTQFRGAAARPAVAPAAVITVKHNEPQAKGILSSALTSARNLVSPAGARLSNSFRRKGKDATSTKSSAAQVLVTSTSEGQPRRPLRPPVRSAAMPTGAPLPPPNEIQTSCHPVSRPSLLLSPAIPTGGESSACDAPLPRSRDKLAGPPLDGMPQTGVSDWRRSYYMHSMHAKSVK